MKNSCLDLVNNNNIYYNVFDVKSTDPLAFPQACTGAWIIMAVVFDSLPVLFPIVGFIVMFINV